MRVILLSLNQRSLHARHYGMCCSRNCRNAKQFSICINLSLGSLMVQFSSVAQSCPTLCNSMNHSTPDLPVHHQLPESLQTHVHWVGDAIQPSHPLYSPSPPALDLSQHQGLFKCVHSSHQVAKVLEFSFNISPSNEHPELISFRMLIGYPCSPRDSQESSPTPQFKSTNSLQFSFLYSPTLTSIHDYWKNHSLH